MKKLHYFLMSLFLLSSCSNTKLHNDDKNRNKFLKPYTDSINNFIKSSKVPAFLFDPCFDNQPYYWNGMHSPVSLREMIIKKVKNKNALDFFIANYAKELSIKCSKEVDSSGIYSIRIPNYDKSFYDLLSNRLMQLK